MYRKFSVKNFRGILSAEISQLSRINLVVGENGSGKSALLEALWLHANPSITTLSQVDSFRQLSWVPVNGVGGPEVPWRHLFHELSDPILFSGTTDTADWTYSISQMIDAFVEFPPSPALQPMPTAAMPLPNPVSAATMNPARLALAYTYQFIRAGHSR